VMMMMIYLILSHATCLVRATKHHLNLARLTRCKQPNMLLLHALNQAALSCHFLTWYHSLGLVRISIRTFLPQCSLWPHASVHLPMHRPPRTRPCTVHRTPAHALATMCLLQLAQLHVQASTTGCPATSGLRGLSPPCELSAFSYVKKKEKEKIEKRRRVGIVPWCSVAFNDTN
jgi:hypothetical protein